MDSFKIRISAVYRYVFGGFRRAPAIAQAIIRYGSNEPSVRDSNSSKEEVTIRPGCSNEFGEAAA